MGRARDAAMGRDTDNAESLTCEHCGRFSRHKRLCPRCSSEDIPEPVKMDFSKPLTLIDPDRDYP